MKKQIFCLLLTFFFLTIVTCQAENKDKVYTDQDIKSLDYEHVTPENKPHRFEYKDATPQYLKEQQQIQQKIEEERIRIQQQQKQIAKTKTMDTNQFGIIVNQLLTRYIGLSFITSAPFIFVFFQIGLAIREHTINTRKEYNSENSDYEMLKWISITISYIAILQFIIGILFIIISL